MTNPVRLLIVDDTEVPWWAFWRPEPWWEGMADAERADVIDNFHNVVKAKSVGQAMDSIAQLKPKHVQICGHGSPGRPSIGGVPFHSSDERWKFTREVWFRSCAVAQGTRGIAFCEELAAWGVNVAAHLSNIGGLGHSNLVGVRAGGQAFWRAKDKPKPGFDRFVLPTTMHLPAWAFEEDA